MSEEPKDFHKRCNQALGIAFVVILFLIFCFTVVELQPQSCYCNCNCSPCCPVIELDKEWKWTGDGTITGGYLAMYLADSQGAKIEGTDWSTTGAWDHTWTGLDEGTYQIFANYTITVNGETLDTGGVYLQVDGDILLECHKDVTNTLDKPTNGHAANL